MLLRSALGCATAVVASTLAQARAHCSGLSREPGFTIMEGFLHELEAYINPKFAKELADYKAAIAKVRSKNPKAELASESRPARTPSDARSSRSSLSFTRDFVEELEAHTGPSADRKGQGAVRARDQVVTPSKTSSQVQKRNSTAPRSAQQIARSSTVMVSPAPARAVVSADDDEEVALRKVVEEKYNTLYSVYQERIQSVTCTEEELELLKCYSDCQLSPNPDYLACRSLVDAYQKCVQAQY